MTLTCKQSAKTASAFMERRLRFMEQKTLFKLMSLVGLALGGIGTLLSSWADSKEQEALIEEKVNEALAARESEEAEEPCQGSSLLEGRYE